MREESRRPPAGPAADAAEAAFPAVHLSGTRWLRYVGAASVSVRGPVTQRAYAFTSARAVQSVDVRDAIHFLRTGLFRAAA